jgi:hypothetical protein
MFQAHDSRGVTIARTSRSMKSPTRRVIFHIPQSHNRRITREFAIVCRRVALGPAAVLLPLLQAWRSRKLPTSRRFRFAA